MPSQAYFWIGWVVLTTVAMRSVGLEIQLRAVGERELGAQAGEEKVGDVGFGEWHGGSGG